MILEIRGVVIPIFHVTFVKMKLVFTRSINITYLSEFPNRGKWVYSYMTEYTEHVTNHW